MHEAAQHRQHALALPDRVQGLELLDALFPRQFVGGDARQRRQRKAGSAGREGRPCQRTIERIGDRLQPAQHVRRLQAVDDGILVRQVDALHLALGQRAPDRRSLLAVAHQNRNIGRHQSLEFTVVVAKAGLRVVQQADDMLGAVVGKKFAVFDGFQVVARRTAHHQRLERPVDADQALAASMRPDRVERQRIDVAFLEPERAGGKTVFGVQEQGVDRLHHRLCRAVVGAELVVAACGRGARRQVTVDVGAAKAVDRLLRVADQEQAVGAVVVADPVQQVENGVLVGRRVLELVDHRHRVLRRDARPQLLAVVALEGRFQPLEHVGKTELAAVHFQFGDAPRDAPRRMAVQGVRQRRDRF